MENQQHSNWDTIEGQFFTPLGRVQVVRGSWNSPFDESGLFSNHHLELNLIPIPGGAKGCFVDSWGPNKFEAFGRIFFVPAHQRLHFKSNCRQQKSIVCDFDPVAVDTWFERNLEWTESRLRHMLNIGNNRISNLLYQLGEEISNPGFASATMVELLSSQVIVELARHLQNIDEDKIKGGLSPWRLSLIEQRIGDVEKQPALTELADLCGISVRHLTRAFRNSTGLSIGSYIAEKRAEHAKRLIASGMSIKSVAYTMGFSAPSNFTAAFSRIAGETPRQYRQRVASSSTIDSTGTTKH